jgi:hypothetical protein
MIASAPIEAPRLLADAARIMCPTMIDTDVPAPANRSDHPRAQLAVMATNVKAAMGITQ